MKSFLKFDTESAISNSQKNQIFKRWKFSILIFKSYFDHLYFDALNITALLIYL